MTQIEVRAIVTIDVEDWAAEYGENSIVEIKREVDSWVRNRIASGYVAAQVATTTVVIH
jgi:hypothetical protein